MVNDLATDRIDEVFHALANESRRAIVRRLAAGPATVGEVGAPLGMSPPAVTKHLKVLEGAGLVSRRIEGRTHRLTLVPDPLERAGTWIGDIEAFWERALSTLERQLEEEGS